MRGEYGNGAYKNYSNDIDIIKILKQLLVVKNIAFMVMAGILAGIIAFCYSKFMLPELYTSSVAMYVNNSDVKYGNDTVDMATLATSRNLADSYVIILKNDVVMEEVGAELLKMYSPEDISQYFNVSEKDGKQYIKGKYINGCFSIAPIDNTEILQVSVTTKDPLLSANICNCMVKVAPVFLKRVIGAGSVEAIGAANIPEAKSYPNNSANTMKGVFVGVFIVVLIMLLRILLDNKIRNSDRFKEKFDYPVLGEIPLVDGGNNSNKHLSKVKGDNNELVAMESFHATEAFNSLCNNLMVTMSMNDEKIIVVSSPEMSDGKSTVALYLAKTLAKMDNRVLLMDLDLRRPSIHKKLSLANKKGIINLMVKNSETNNALHKNFFDNLDILLTGGISPNPSEMLSSKRMNEILEKYKDMYDYIIIDSPPVNVVTDACIISQMAAGILVVIRANEAHFDDFSKTIENIEVSRSRVLGVVLNGVDESSVKYGRKYRYGSKYGYKYGYYDEVDNKKA